MPRKKKAKRQTKVVPVTPVLKVETSTAPTPPLTKKNDYTGDPLWNTRRIRLDISLALSFGTIFYGMSQGPEMTTAIAPPAFLTIGGVIGFYFGISEWGRINGVLGTTTKTQTSVNTKSQTTVDPQKEE